KTFVWQLQSQTGLKLNGLGQSWVGAIGEFCLLLALMAILPLLAWSLIGHPGGYWWAGFFVVFFGSFVLMRLDPGCWEGSVGALARKAARDNYGRLMKQGAHGQDAEIWRITTDVLCEESLLNPQDVTRDTVFFRKQLNAA